MNNNNVVYEYKIYIPYCNNKLYEYENNSEEIKKENLSNLFEVKSTNFYFKIDYISDDAIEFSLYNNNGYKYTQLKEGIKIENNDYLIKYKVKKISDIDNSQDIIINYTVSFKDDNDDNNYFYSKQCQIKFISLPCYPSCEKCSINKYGSNITNHNCKICKEKYYPSPIVNTNVIWKMRRKLIGI